MTIRKRGSALTLRDRLSHLSFPDACKHLGARGAVLIREGGAFEVDLATHVSFDAARFEMRIPRARGREVVVRLWLAEDRRLRWECSACNTACEHVGAAFSVVLEDKLALGLAEPPREPAASPTDLVARAIADREERARTEKTAVRTADPSTPWTDYTVTSTESGRSYRVALRSEERGDSYCSCPDFRKNTLGTCKHILARARQGPAPVPGRGARQDVRARRHLGAPALRRRRRAACQRTGRAVPTTRAPSCRRCSASRSSDVRDLVQRARAARAARAR